MTTLEQTVGRIRERFPEAVQSHEVHLEMDVVVISRDRLTDALRLLRDDEQLAFNLLADVSSVDWLPREPRWDVNYHLYSMSRNVRLRVKVHVPGDDPAVPSCVSIWPTADWQEREVFDLMGITFTGHPNLRRIIMPDEWEGHPHRKDYPIGGVPVEYKIEPAYLGLEESGRVSAQGRPSMGGIPIRTRRDRGRPSPWTWTGPPATGVRHPEPPVEEVPMGDEEQGSGDD